MTALVGLLNKRGAAIAADSAMTVLGNGSSKIYNNEQKIFQLSSQNPVGVMICNNLNFLNTPLALILDLYRIERGNCKFSSLTGYVDDFIAYLKSIKRLQDSLVKRTYYRNEFDQIITDFRSTFSDRYDQIEEENQGLSEDEISRMCYVHTLGMMKETICDTEINENLTNFTKQDFVKEVVEPDKETFARYRTMFPRMKDEEWETMLEYFYIHLISNSFNSRQSSEIIFVGFGSDDIFPASQRLFLSGMVGDGIKYRIEDISEISHDYSAEIRPFAQTDVMMTLIKGVSPQLDNEFREATLELEEGLINDFTTVLEEEHVSPVIIKKLKELPLEKLHDRYIDRIDNYVNENFISGVVDALEFFNLEEMTKMAENLIAVTNLQRHISSSEESVGGPIEVALITKAGGFKWIKHNCLE